MPARVLIGLLCLTLGSACAPSSPATTRPAGAPAARSESPKRARDCAQCHAAIAAEWRQSMHAQSTLDRDPLYRLLYAKAKAHHADLERSCRRCHYPTSASQAHPDDGVGCTTCHRLAADHPEPMQDGRVAALATADGRALCLACHDTLARPDGLQVCSTGPEASAAGGRDCAKCHMPTSAGPAHDDGSATSHRSHRFPGAFDARFLAGAASLTITPGTKRFEVRIQVDPDRVGHALPTGNPMRHVVLLVTALDAAGKPIWSNLSAQHPLFDQDQVVFMRLFRGPDGRGPVPPFLAAGPAEDNRLKPGIPVTRDYPIPAGAAKLVAELSLVLGPAKLLAAAQAPPDWHAPRPIARAEASLASQ